MTGGRYSPEMFEKSQRTLARGSSTYSDDATNADDTTVADDTTTPDDTTTADHATYADNTTVAEDVVDGAVTTAMLDLPDYQSDARPRGFARVAHWGNAWPDASDRSHTQGRLSLARRSRQRL
jgi:hypothetical protein